MRRNHANLLSATAAVVGVGLLAIAEPGTELPTVLGTLLLIGAVVVAGFGKAIDLLGHVRDGATESSDGT